MIRRIFYVLSIAATMVAPTDYEARGDGSAARCRRRSQD